MKKTLTGFLACATMFSLTPTPSAANTLYGEIQRNKVAPESLIGPTVRWITSQSVPTAELFSDSIRFASSAIALIVGGTSEPPPLDNDYFIDFDYLFLRNPSAPPLVPVEYFENLHPHRDSFRKVPNHSYLRSVSTRADEGQ